MCLYRPAIRLYPTQSECVHRDLPSDTIPNKLNPLQPLTLYFPKISFNIILPPYIYIYIYHSIGVFLLIPSVRVTCSDFIIR